MLVFTYTSGAHQDGGGRSVRNGKEGKKNPRGTSLSAKKTLGSKGKVGIRDHMRIDLKGEG